MITEYELLKRYSKWRKNLLNKINNWIRYKFK